MNDGNIRMDDVIAPSANIPPQPSTGTGVPSSEEIDLIASSPTDADSDRSGSPGTVESNGVLEHYQPTVGDALQPHVVDMPESKSDVSIPPAPEAGEADSSTGNARQIGITTPEVATDRISIPPQPGADEISVPPQPGVDGNPTPERQVTDSLPSDPETAEEIGDVALGVDNEQEPDKPASDEEVIDLGEGNRPMLAPEGEPEQAEDSISEMASGNISPETDSSSSEAIDELDKEVTRAGDKAVAKLMHGMPKELSPEEQKTIDTISERVRNTAEEEALADKEKSPEALVFKKLDAIKTRLEEAGLNEDAELVAEQTQRLYKLIDQATDIIKDPTELPLFKRPGEPDANRLRYLIGLQGGTDRDLVYSVPLSIDLGNGKREDRAGTRYELPEQSERSAQIEKAGGLQPVLSDQALEILLEEAEILPAGEKLSSLDNEVHRPYLVKAYYHKDLGTDGGSVQLSKEIPSGQLVNYRASAVGGRVERTVGIGFEPDFVINAALRRIEAN